MTQSPVITTQRLTLRKPDARDIDAMVTFFADVRSGFYGGPKSRGDAWRYLALQLGIWALRGYGMFAIELTETGETIGFAGPYHPGDFDEPELSWLLSESRFEGQGFASEAVEAARTYCFAAQGWDSVASFIDRDNAASRALAIRLGAERDETTISPIPNCDTWRHFAPADGGMEAYA